MKQGINWALVLTYVRLISIPILYVLWMYQKWTLFGVCFAMSVFTDIADGYVARTYNMITPHGQLLDALVDKILITTLYILMSIQPTNLLPYWFILFIFAREFIMVAGGFFLLLRVGWRDVKARAAGKSIMIGHCLLVAMLLGTLLGCSFCAEYIMLATYLIMVASIVSLIDYGMVFIRTILRATT